MSAIDLPKADYLALAADDILFVDSSHTVKRGSDVDFLVLEALPRLSRGVCVHLHDIFLPYDYRREWFVREDYFAEQYLIHGFLIDNPTYEVLFAAHAMARAHHDELRELVPALTAGPSGSASLWLRRCA